MGCKPNFLVVGDCVLIIATPLPAKQRFSGAKNCERPDIMEQSLSLFSPPSLPLSL